MESVPESLTIHFGDHDIGIDKIVDKFFAEAQAEAQKAPAGKSLSPDDKEICKEQFKKILKSVYNFEDSGPRPQKIEIPISAHDMRTLTGYDWAKPKTFTLTMDYSSDGEESFELPLTNYVKISEELYKYLTEENVLPPDTFNDKHEMNIYTEAARNLLKIDVSGRGIESLKDIKHFGRLAYLDCSDNNLTTLDISKNLVGKFPYSKKGNFWENTEESPSQFNDKRKLDYRKTFGAFGDSLEKLKLKVDGDVKITDYYDTFLSDLENFKELDKKKLPSAVDKNDIKALGDLKYLLDDDIDLVPENKTGTLKVTIKNHGEPKEITLTKFQTTDGEAAEGSGESGDTGELTEDELCKAAIQAIANKGNTEKASDLGLDISGKASADAALTKAKIAEALNKVDDITGLAAVDIQITKPGPGEKTVTIEVKGVTIKVEYDTAELTEDELCKAALSAIKDKTDNAEKAKDLGLDISGKASADAALTKAKIAEALNKVDDITGLAAVDIQITKPGPGEKTVTIEVKGVTIKVEYDTAELTEDELCKAALSAIKDKTDNAEKAKDLGLDISGKASADAALTKAKIAEALNKVDDITGLAAVDIQITKPGPGEKTVTIEVKGVTIKVEYDTAELTEDELCKAALSAIKDKTDNAEKAKDLGLDISGKASADAALTKAKIAEALNKVDDITGLAAVDIQITKPGPGEKTVTIEVKGVTIKVEYDTAELTEDELCKAALSAIKDKTDNAEKAKDLGLDISGKASADAALTKAKIAEALNKVDDITGLAAVDIQITKPGPGEKTVTIEVKGVTIKVEYDTAELTEDELCKAALSAIKDKTDNAEKAKDLGLDISGKASADAALTKAKIAEALNKVDDITGLAAVDIQITKPGPGEKTATITVKGVEITVKYGNKE